MNCKYLLLLLFCKLAQSLEITNWLTSVNSQTSKCVKHFGDGTVVSPEEIFKLVSCEESWAIWSYKYKNRDVSLKLKDPWKGHVTVKFSNHENSNIRDGLKSKKCFDLRSHPGIEEIQGVLINEKLEGPVLITFYDGTTLIGNAKNNRFEGIVRHFGKDGDLSNVTRADTGFVMWSQDKPDVIFIPSKTNTEEMFILKSNDKILNCKTSMRLFGYNCREVQPESHGLVHVDECLVFFHSEPQPLDNEWQKFTLKFEKMLGKYELPCEEKENWNEENIGDRVLQWMQDLKKDDYWPWFQESILDPFDPVHPRLEITIPFLVGRSTYLQKNPQIIIKSRNRELLVADIFDGKISVDVPENVAKLEEWNYPIYFYFQKPYTSIGFGMSLEVQNSSYFMIGRIRQGRLHGLVFTQGTFSNDPKGVCSSNSEESIGLIARYDNGKAVGKAWKGLMGNAWIHGTVDEDGNFSGDDVAFVYPDYKIGLKGTFKNNLMVEGQAVTVIGEKCDEFGMKELKFSDPTGPIFHYNPPTEESLGDESLLVDPLDDHYVDIRPYSGIQGGGEGSFAKVDIPKGTVFALYSGYIFKSENVKKFHEKQLTMRKEGILPEDPKMLSMWMYRLGFRECSLTIDLPGEFGDVTKYRATRGHKFNHSFNPNTVFYQIDSPRFGRIRSMLSNQDIKAGDELFVDYGYNFSGGPKWFKEVVLNTTRADPDFFKKNKPFVTNGKSLEELEKEYEEYLKLQEHEIPLISEESEDDEKSS